MEEIAISKFKATCLAVIDRVRKSGEPILVTRFGQPLVKIQPLQEFPKPVRQFTDLGGTLKIHGDIVGPISDISEWDAYQDPKQPDEP